MEVLATLFGSQSIMTLDKYISAVRPANAPAIVQPMDGARFLSFLHGTLVIPCLGPGQPQHQIDQIPEYTITSTLNQILDQVQHRFQSRVHHVLTDGAPGDPKPQRSRAQLRWNTIRNHLLNHNWTCLLERVGDEPIRLLLMRCSVFESLPNGCYLQVAGHALYSYNKIKHVTAADTPSHPIIRTADLLYSRSGVAARPRLSKHHLLNRVGQQQDSALHLLCHIFDLGERGGAAPSHRRLRLNRSYCALLPLLRSMIMNHCKLNYVLLLKSTCPIAGEYDVAQQEAAVSEIGSGAGAVRLLLRQYSSVQDVAKFLRYVIMRVIPFRIWGCKANFAVVCRAIHFIVQMRRFDQVDVHHLVQGVKISLCPWIYRNGGRSAALTNQSMFNRLFGWVLKGFLVPVVREYFYCTESEPYRNRILLYRHEVWRKIQHLSMQRFTQNQFQQVAVGATDHVFGVSKLRLLPKLSSVRPLINCSVKNGSRRGPVSINQRLRPSQWVVNLELEGNRSALGSSCSGLESIHDRVSPFFSYLHQASATLGKAPPVYIVGVDLSKCFDKIRRGRLMQILDRLLEQTDYFTFPWVALQFAPYNHRIWTRFHRIAMKAPDIPQFAQFAEQRARLARNTVYVEQIGCEQIGRDQVLELINDHISRNAIQCDGSLYTQTCGIPQGSVLSTILCSLYLADLERTELRPVLGLDTDNWVWADHGGAGVLLRHVDDFLLMTTSKSRAAAFLNRMCRGFDDYNCHVNPAKTRANFDTGLPDVVVNDAIPWCGYLFEWIKGGELLMRNDYSRMVSLPSIADTLFIRCTVGRQFHQFGDRLVRQYIRAKAHPALLDANINPKRVVALNTYQMFRLAFIKMCSYLGTIHAGVRPRFIQQCFCNVLIGFHQALKRTSMKQAWDFRVLEVKWLALHAFRRVLVRKQARFRVVLDWIRGALRERRMVQISACKQLQFALASADNAAFTKIAY